MNETNKSALAAALMGGYLLGRTKKGKMAFALATFVAGRRFGLNPRGLAGEGMRRLSESPQFGEVVEQVRGELLHAGRAAARALAERRMDALAGSLRSLTDGLAGQLPETPRPRVGSRSEDGQEQESEDKAEKAPEKPEGRREKQPARGKGQQHRDRPRQRTASEQRPARDRSRREKAAAQGKSARTGSGR